MGGDNSPEKTISGVKIFIDKNKGKDDFILNLFGDENKITKLIQSKNIPTQSLKVIHSDSVVSDNETPLTAIKNSKNTSMWKCINYQLEGNANISLLPGIMVCY